MLPKPIRAFLTYTFLLLFVAACGKQQTLQAIFQKSTPHDTYARRLRQAGLDQTALGRDWLAAADRALHDSLVVTLPFTETGIFRADRAKAAAYRYSVREGETVRISLQLTAGTDAHVFLDAFELNPDRSTPRLLASADTADLSFSYVAEDDRQHLLRVQPELLRNGRYTLSIRREPSLGFPVLGKTDAAVGSFWGMARDGGARRHEGVDIFAKRGTPVVAAAPGLVTRTGVTNLGGNVVWLADSEHGQHLYYAHLDKQLVQPGQVVHVGDTLGLVGNTGNARTTSPHLHFGIYRAGGAVDPFPFIRRADAAPAAPRTAPERLGQWVRVREKRTDLRLSPTKLGSTLAGLPHDTPLLVVGSQADWYRVERPDGRVGYVTARAVVPASTTPLRREALAAATDLYAHPAPDAVALDTLPAHASVAVLGEFGGFRLVRSAAGVVGWLISPMLKS